MFSSAKNGSFSVETLPIIGPYNRQRFPQWSPEDNAGWYVVKDENTKEKFAMYPTLGRKHINYLGLNQLIFGSEPRALFKSINYAYIVEGSTVFRVDSNYNKIDISGSVFETISGAVYFSFLVVNSIVFACFVDGEKIYIYQENSGVLQLVTDPNAPGNFTVNGVLAKPGYIATFGNRIVVSVANSSQFVLSVINLLDPVTGMFNPATCFTNAVTPQIFAQEDGIIRQMGVLNNTLYIYTDYVTGVWSNIPAVFSGTGVSFPWKKNSTYNWNFGIANPTSLDIDFGIMVFLARNSDGLLQFMMSNGGQPERISNKAIDTLLQNYTNLYGIDNPFLSANSNGFLYQYENTIFYRMSGGEYVDYGILDQEQNANSIEFSFEAEEWHRVIELNGNRNRVQQHVYFNFKHLVTVVDEGTVYDMSGQYYFNEIRNPAEPEEQAIDAYLVKPFRYERITPIIYEKDYAEFETEYAQVDFVWGIGPVVLTDLLFKPSVELYFSDDGGISFFSADNLEFSKIGVYSWRMRWYQLGCSRNRVYKLIAVSDTPIVILGAVMNVRRVSGGAN